MVTELCCVPCGALRYCRVDYCDEAVRDSSQTVPVDIHQPPAFLHKILQLNSVQLLYETLGGSQVRVRISICVVGHMIEKTQETHRLQVWYRLCLISSSFVCYRG